jgi:hypothetical protein
MFLLTVKENGWPHNAIVSAGEVTAIDRTTLRLALCPGTTTTENAKRRKKQF